MLRRFLAASALAAASLCFVPSTATAGGTVVLTATKTVSGTFRPGGAIVYTIVLANNGTSAQADNSGPELIDGLAGGLIVTSMTATNGTLVIDGPLMWNGTVPAGGTTTITINATIDPALIGLVRNQAIVFYDADANGSNESIMRTDDPSTPAPNDPTDFTAVPFPHLIASKQGGGSLRPNTPLYYNVRIDNLGGPHGDNPGDEFVDVIPAGLTLVSATATSGTVVADVGTNTVRWNGAVGMGEFTLITITTMVPADAAGSYTNQGTLTYDADGDGINETSVLSDDPTLPGTADPTVVTIATLPASFNFAMYAYSANDIVERGGRVYFDIIATNLGGTDQGDNPGDEIVAVLPSVLTYESSYALNGTTAFDPATRRFTWNGALPRGAFVGMTIATRLSTTADGAYWSQATLSYDSDRNGTNDATQLSDDPRTPTPSDPAGFQVIVPVPALGWPALLLAAAGLAFAARLRLRRATT
ncbi:MAG TPA: hypothetical protein VM555_01475 [Tahibacter sp.]|jgi:uncharacterized repeat protein (TIGR01451 family)|nr:hypothetical protein [Tahibacter sp.]